MNPVRAHFSSWSERSARWNLRYAILLGASLWLASSYLIVAQSAKPDLSAEDFAEVYTDRYIPPKEDLLLGRTGQNRGKALAYYYLGLSREKAGDIEGALDAFEAAIKTGKSNLNVSHRAAELAGKFGDSDRGREILEESFKLNLDNPAAYSQLSTYLWTYHENKSENREEALSIMEDAAKRFPDNASVYGQLVNLYLRLKNRTKAKEMLSRATSQKSQDANFWLAIAKIAQNVYPKRGSDFPEEVTEIYEKAYRFGKGDLKVQSVVANFFTTAGQLEKARDAWEEIIKRHPEALTARERLASVYQRLGDVDKMIEALTALVGIDPHRVATQRRLGQIFYERDDWANSIKHYMLAFRKEKGEAVEYMIVGHMMMWEDRSEEAVDLLQRGLFHYEDDVRIKIAYGMAHNAIDKHEEAFGIFKETEKLAQDQSRDQYLDASFYFSYGAAAERSEMIPEAEDLFRKSIDMVPPDQEARAAIAYNYLGYMWLENDMNIDEAGQLIIKANELNPGSGAYIDSLGWYYFKKENYEDALVQLLTSAKMLEDEGHPDGVVLDHVGQTYFKLGHNEKAIELLQKAVDLEPKNEEFAERLKEYMEAEKQEAKPLDFLEEALKKEQEKLDEIKAKQEEEAAEAEAAKAT